ncbi:TlpA disulfide reductase family protein [Cognatilysobacter lacus]
MPRMIRRIAAVAMFATALAGCGDRVTPPAGTASQPQASKPANAPTPQTASAPSKPAPADRQHPHLQLALVDGKRYDLAQHRGRWVVVNFWATWCGPCLKEMPELSALASKGTVDVIGLAYEDIEAKDMQAFLATHKPAYPIAILDTFNPPADFDTPRGLPMTVIVAPDGSVAKTVLGPVTTAVIEQAISQHGTKASG